MKSKAIQRWMARGGRVPRFDMGGKVLAKEYYEKGYLERDEAKAMGDIGEKWNTTGTYVPYSSEYEAKAEKASRKGYERWHEPRGESDPKIRKYASGGEVEALGLPSMLADDDEGYSGSDKIAKSGGKFGNFEEDYEGSKRVKGSNSIFGFGNMYNQGGFVNRLPYDYQDEPDFGASGVDTNYGSWDEEEDEEAQPAGITISFASALQKRKRK